MTASEVRRAVRACRPHFVAAAAFSLGINILYLSIPLYMLQVYDRVLSSGSVPTLVMLTIGCLIALAALAALDVVRSRVLVRSGLRFDEILTSRVIAATLERANDVGDRERGQAIRDVDTVRNVMTGSGLNALFDIPWTPVYIALIFVIHPLLGAFSLASSLVLLALAVCNELVTRRVLSAGNAAAARSHLNLAAHTRNAEVVHALGMTSALTERLVQERRPALRHFGAAGDRGAWLAAAIKFLRLLMQVLMLGLAAYLVIDRSITAGAMFAAAIILGRALQPLEQLVGAWRSLLTAKDAFRRVAGLLTEQPAPSPRMSLPRPAGKVEVKNVSCHLPGSQQPILNGMSFGLQPGECLAVIGPSAAGKTTLARVIVGVRQPCFGTVRIDGADIAAWDREELARHLGYVPQDVELFAGTVAENIARFSAVDSEKVIAAATLAGAHETVLGLAQGYETQVGEGGCYLSGGQRQRIALARAVFGNPTLVVLDEPNSNLDGEGETALCASLERLKAAGTTVIIVSHRVNVLNCADKILQLRAGTVEAFGTRQEFMERMRQSRIQSIRSAIARTEGGL